MRVIETFWAFLKLGCIAFGGPTAHLAYFEDVFVKRRKWLGAAEYSELLALCQFLPGPGSSQVGFAIGLKRAGVLGAFAAWLGFTAPAALLMIGFALGLTHLGDVQGALWLDGLLVAAVAVVANAVLNMGQKLCNDRGTLSIAVLAALALIWFPFAWLQLFAITAGAIIGAIYFRNEGVVEDGSSGDADQGNGAPYLIAFFVLLLGLPLASRFWSWELLSVGDAFYRAGSLVFGGGHVVLPLLDSYTVQTGWVNRDSFLAGYGAAQAIPGPLFTFTAYLGAAMNMGWGGALGGLWALIVTYLPAWLLVLGVMPLWARVRSIPRMKRALRGVNAAVVGVLVAAFYNPVLTAGVQSVSHGVLALAAFLFLRFAKSPPWLVVLACALMAHLAL
ncbi:MAG: chromate efflux transporter [Opitutales bacterium]